MSAAAFLLFGTVFLLCGRGGAAPHKREGKHGSFAFKPRQQEYLDIDGALSSFSFDDGALDFNAEDAGHEVEFVRRSSSDQKEAEPALTAPTVPTEPTALGSEARPLLVTKSSAEIDAMASAPATHSDTLLVRSEFEATFDDDDAA